MADATDPTSAGQDEHDWWTGGKARVFVSCGQRDSEERRIAGEVRDAIRDLGFAPYLAVVVHSSQSLTEGIYGHLRTAEYFLFIDFKRERLGWFDGFRGSLFSNQELGIASFIGLESLFFVERAIRPRDGILGAIQGNAIPFVDRRALPAEVTRSIQEARWEPTARRELRVEPLPAAPSRANISAAPNPPVIVWYWQFRLRNLHTRILATDCRIQSIGLRGPSAPGRSDSLEIKFAGVTWPTVALPPDSTREFDALVVPDNDPSSAVLGVLNPGYVDSARMIADHTVHGPGDYEADFLVLSREFRPIRGTMTFHLGKTISDVSLGWKGR
jgi:hypothetical protein